MNFLNTNRRAATLAASALAGIGLLTALPQFANAQMGAGKPMPGAQGGMDPAQRAKMIAAQKKMMADLHITPDQQAKMNKVKMDMQPKMLALRTNKSLTDAQKQTQMMALATKYRAQMNAILTPEQQAKIKAMMQQRMGQMKPGGAAKPAH